ncbi:unnamed protein product [Larinioides sclopetarius]|uniref:Uncharacterized protein n=1 Tax=Larinioides sclopetarius TaxID=280406 RepID=A0AAV2C1F2_9ARAC
MLSWQTGFLLLTSGRRWTLPETVNAFRRSLGLVFLSTTNC